MKKRFNILNLIIPLTVLMLFFVTIGYSLLETSLAISGNGLFVVDDGLRISNAMLFSSTGVLENYSPNYTDDSIMLDFSLSSLSSQATYRVTIANNTSTEVRLDTISLINYSNSDIVYEIATIPSIIYILSNSTSEVDITFKYRSDLTTLPTNTNLSATLKLNYSTDLTPTSYYNSNLIMDLSGEDVPITDESGVLKWADRTVNGNDLTLTNVSYDEMLSTYEFPGSNSCAISTNTAIIPTTGNYTLQLSMKNSKHSSLTDESVVSQKIIGSSTDEGRFKPFNVFNQTIRFWGRPDYHGNYVSAIDNTVVYHLTLVMKDGIYITYVNGIEETRLAMPKGSFISSGTLQLGCFDGITSQNFYGDIRSFRVYDYALTSVDIYNNYLYDSDSHAELNAFNLFEYAQKHHEESTSTVSGIYEDEITPGRYIYRGMVSNYIMIDNEMWRIMAFEDNHTIKVFKPDLINIAFDESGYRTFSNTASPQEYCDMASTTTSDGATYGCNAFRKSTDLPDGVFTTNARSGVVDKDSSLYTELNTTIYNGFSEKAKSMIKQDGMFYFGPTMDRTRTVNLQTIYDETRIYSYSGRIGTLDLYDVMASGMSYADGFIFTNSYFSQYISSTSYLWTMNSAENASGSNTYDVRACVIYLSQTACQLRRASRSSQLPAYLYAVPVVYIDHELIVRGTGTVTDPFIFVE